MRQMQNSFGPRGGGPRGAAGFQKVEGRKKEVLWRLIKYVVKNYKFSYIAVMVCILISSVTTLVSTLFTRTLIDDYIVPLTQADNPEYTSLAQALFRLGLVLLFGVICSYTYNRLMINVSQGTLLRLRKSMFEHMQRLPISYFDSHSHGNVMSTYTNDVDTLRQMVGSSLPQVFNTLITLCVTFVSMVVLSVPLTCVSILLAVLMVFTTTQLGKRSRSFFKVQQQSLAQVNGFIEEMMTGQKVVKVFCHEDEAISEFETINEQLRSSSYNANRIANIVMPVNGNLGNLGYVLIAVVGATIALASTPATAHFFAAEAFQPFSLSLGTIVAFLTLNKSFTQPIAHVSQQINSVLNASVGAERVFDLLDEKPERDEGHWIAKDGQWVNEDSGEKRVENGERRPILGDVDFKDVDFSYVPEKQVLFDIDINTNPGQKIAFVGGTGAGKTTIINLINRFYDVQGGHILFDGIPIADIQKSSLRRSLGMVLQETHLFTGTVLDNIRYGRLEATDRECVEAAKLVGADDFIRRLANGYQTMLSGDGSNLSQGERQLLAIARAAVANPPVLILDEATSSIDTRTETLVQRGMDSLMHGRTTFVIAHRLSTVRNSDIINVMDHGRIIEQGNHEQLLALRGKYYQLYTGDDSMLK
ncbi:MAG: ABC transporter ATP-binding protein [Prevotella sp.]|nr:ABC transporter ATP-binding protein [Prevotella sp.]